MDKPYDTTEREEGQRVLESYANPILKDARACPFCSGKTLALTDWADIMLVGKPTWRVYCASCGTLGPMSNTRQSAVNYWNQKFDARLLMNLESG